MKRKLHAKIKILRIDMTARGSVGQRITEQFETTLEIGVRESGQGIRDVVFLGRNPLGGGPKIVLNLLHRDPPGHLQPDLLAGSTVRK